MITARLLIPLALLMASQLLHAAPQELRPASDAEVLEKLPARIRGVSPATTPQAAEQAAAQTAREWITLARKEADPRYLGRAQAVLAPWWDKPDAPPALAVLQATVQQSRHEFDAARKVLETTLKRHPAEPQGWLTLATLERVAGRYPAAELACQQVARFGGGLYAQACRLETRSLQGHFDEAREGYLMLVRQTSDAGTRAWLLSLLAESEERAGRDADAARTYATSLATDNDTYTALAYADLLLRTGKPKDAVKVLRDQPASDAVLLRRARARQLTGDAGWRDVATELRERFAELDARGESRAPHARERTQAALWLEIDPEQAAQFAQLNLGLQKEPLDWWLALRATQLKGQTQQAAAVREALRASGLVDARLARLLREDKP